jgi:hypothetical protein
MTIRPFVIAVFCVLWFRVGSIRAQSGVPEPQSCFSASRKIEALVRAGREPKDLSLQIVPLPRLQDALVSLEVSAASPKQPTVIQVQFCEVVVSTFQVQDGILIGTTVSVDRDLPTWIVGLAPGGKTFSLSGFTDSILEFNKLTDTIGLQVTNTDLASEVFDFYLKLIDSPALRESIVVDEMQLQCKALEDFRLRHSLPKARSEYARWWANISLAVRNELHRPSVTAEQNGFQIAYFRYFGGQVLREVVHIGKNGTVKVAGSKAIYAPADFQPR